MSATVERIDMGDLLFEGPELTDTEGGSHVQMCRSSPCEPSRVQWMRIQETSCAFDFWNRPEEDIYTIDDGEPV